VNGQAWVQGGQKIDSKLNFIYLSKILGRFIMKAGVYLIGMALVLAGACADADIEISEKPRFVHKPLPPILDIDPTPDNRPHYPKVFAKGAKDQRDSCVPDLYGFDLQLKYTKDESFLSDSLPDDDERFVQALEYHKKAYSCDGNICLTSAPMAQI